jgi:copper chaperone CopZ
MKHRYHIQGMTCNGCSSHVEKILSSVTGVTNATVNLEKAEATLEMEKHIPFETLQEALKNDGGTYSIHKSAEDLHHPEAKKEKSKGKGTVPILLPNAL